MSQSTLRLLVLRLQWSHVRLPLPYWQVRVNGSPGGRWVSGLGLEWSWTL